MGLCVLTPLRVGGEATWMKVICYGDGRLQWVEVPPGPSTETAPAPPVSTRRPTTRIRRRRPTELLYRPQPGRLVASLRWGAAATLGLAVLWAWHLLGLHG